MMSEKRTSINLRVIIILIALAALCAGGVYANNSGGIYI